MVFSKKRTQDQQQELEVHDVDDVDHVIETQFPGPESEPLHQTSSKPDESKPLLQEVIYISSANSKNAGGSKIWECNHCKRQFTSSYSRIHAHFFGHDPDKPREISRCQVMIDDREKYNMLLNKVKMAEKAGLSKSLKNSVISKKQKTTSKSPLEKAFGVMERSAVDLKILRCLCANGILFNVLQNPQFHEMVTAINKAPSGYKAPSSEKARTSLLDECFHDVEKNMGPIKDTWFTQGVYVVSDGWSDVKRKPLINVVAVNSRGAAFLYAEDFSGVEKTGAAIEKYLLRAIESIGPCNDLQVVTDNAASCKAAGKEIEKVYNHIFWSPCSVHTLNLIFKDFAKEFPWLTAVYKKGKKIVKYFLSHSQPLAMFRANSNIELLQVAKTRFASHYILLKRLKDCREALATTIVLNSWREWVRRGDENTRNVGQEVAEIINNEYFWDDVDQILAITKPIFLLIKFCDGEGPRMGEIYERMDNMVEEIKDVMKDNAYGVYCPEVEKIIMGRWEKMSIPLHCLGFALNPRFFDSAYLDKLAPGGIARKAPNFDEEVMKGVIGSFERIAETEEEKTMLREQFAAFTNKRGMFCLPAAQMNAVYMDVIDWWSTYGSETPELAEIAKKVLSQPISSSSAKRNWSTYSFIQSVKRNRLNNKRADRLVYIHSNIRLQSRFSESYKEGPQKKWDMNPESMYIEGSSSRLKDMQWEDLDD